MFALASMSQPKHLSELSEHTEGVNSMYSERLLHIPAMLAVIALAITACTAPVPAPPPKQSEPTPAGEPAKAGANEKPHCRPAPKA